MESELTTEKTNGKTATYIPSDTVKILQASSLFLLLLDLYLVFFVMVQNADRTFETGLYNALWLQFPIIGALFFIDRYQIKKQQEEISNVTHGGLSKKKIPLHSQVGDNVDDFQSEDRSITDIVFYIVFYDLVIMTILLFYGWFFNPLFIFTVLAYQAYILAPALLIYVYFNRKNFETKLAEHYDIGIDQRSLVEKYRSILPGNKKKILTGLVLLLLSLSMLLAIPVQEDFNTDRVNPIGQTEVNYTQYTPHHVYGVEGGINVVGTMYSPNQYGRLYPSLVFLEIRDGEVIAETKLRSIGRVNESIIDTKVEGQQVLLLLHNNDYLFYEVLQVDMVDTSMTSLAFFNGSGVESYRYRASFTATEDQFILATSPYRVDAYGFTSNIRLIDRDNPTQQTTITNDHSIFDLTEYNDELVMVSQPRNQNQYFVSETLALPLTNTTGEGEIQVLDAGYSENPLDIDYEYDINLLPNGVTLFTVGGEVFYQSSNNIYSISGDTATTYGQNHLFKARYATDANLFQGQVEADGHIILNSGNRLLFFDPSTMEVETTAHALNSGYTASVTGNMILHAGDLINFSTRGSIYYWPSEISSIEINRAVTTGLLVGSAVVFVAASIVLLYSWRDLSSSYYEQYPIRIPTTR